MTIMATMEAAMMERIKSLAVSVLHTAVHTVTLHEAEQAPEESVKTLDAQKSANIRETRRRVGREIKAKNMLR